MRFLSRLTLILAIAVAATGIGVAYAAWTTNGTGTGAAKATSAIDLTTVSASSSTTAQLYPGGSGDLVIKIKNDNPYPVRVTEINNASPAVAITSDMGAACDASTGVTYDDTSGTWDVPANTTSTFTLVNKVHMSNASDTTCQSAVFTIAVDLVGASNA